MQRAGVVSNCHLWPVWPYHAFTHYLINGKNFLEKVIEDKMCVLILSKISV